MASLEMTAGSPTQAPAIEAAMSRELGVVRDHTNYILVEDIDWRRRNRYCCEIRRKYTIRTSPRQFTEREAFLSKREVDGFPVILEVRFGIFPPNLPDTPVWPLESPLLQWTQLNECFVSYDDIKLMLGNGGQLGSTKREKKCTIYLLSLFNNAGDVLYTLHTPYCSNGNKILIYRGKEKEKMGFIRKMFRKQCDALCACDCGLPNWNTASFPAASNAEERLMLLKELVSQSRRLHTLHTQNYN